MKRFLLVLVALALFLPGLAMAQDKKPYEAIRKLDRDWSERVIVDPNYQAKPGERMVHVSVQEGPNRDPLWVSRSVPEGAVKKAPPEPRGSR